MRLLRWLIKKLVMIHYRKTKFLAWCFSVDDHTDIHIVSEEWSPNLHRYGIKEDKY